MSKNELKVIGAVIILLIIGGIYSLVTNPVDKPDEGDKSATTTEPTEVSIMAGSYEVYAPAKLARADLGHVVLFFRAGWCPTCRALDADIKANFSAIPSNLTILDVDYDNSTELKRQYGVTYQHTLVEVDSKGRMIKKWSGSPTLQALVGQVI